MRQKVKKTMLAHDFFVSSNIHVIIFLRATEWSGPILKENRRDVTGATFHCSHSSLKPQNFSSPSLFFLECLLRFDPFARPIQQVPSSISPFLFCATRYLLDKSPTYKQPCQVNGLHCSSGRKWPGVQHGLMLLWVGGRPFLLQQHGALL